MLSTTLIAIGFLDSRPALIAFGATALPALLSVGVLTFVRLLQIGLKDVAHLAAMQKIRRRYATLDADAADYFPDLTALDRSTDSDATPSTDAGEDRDALSFMGLRSARAQVLFTASSRPRPSTRIRFRAPAGRRGHPRAVGGQRGGGRRDADPARARRRACD